MHTNRVTCLINDVVEMGISDLVLLDEGLNEVSRDDLFGLGCKVSCEASNSYHVVLLQSEM